MRLADFILENLESILAEWEAFARSVWPGAATDPHELRDHAADILRATALDMKSSQSATQQSDKSKGEGVAGEGSVRVDGASDVHAVGRVRSGFDMMAVVAEYRAVRASVIRLWRESDPASDLRDLDDLTRFNESIDQSLTEAVRSYTELVDRSRQMFLGILGHDLRNPLNSVMMSSEVLAQSNDLPPEAAQAAAQIATSAAAMARMVGDLLDFTGAGLGASMPLSPGAMDLRALCQEVVDETRAGHPSIAVRFHSKGGLTGVWDAGRLRQVLSNLLGNAVQHGTGPVELSAEGENDEVRISVRNGGVAIPADALATIFDPLVRGPSRASRTRRRRPGSIGLGLYVAREVLTAHGGTIGVESSEKDGTVFTAKLPRQCIGM